MVVCSSVDLFYHCHMVDILFFCYMTTYLVVVVSVLYALNPDHFFVLVTLCWFQEDDITDYLYHHHDASVPSLRFWGVLVCLVREDCVMLDLE